MNKNDRRNILSEVEVVENFNHIPVMLKECIAGLNIKPNGIYVDGTLGMGGHSRVIASMLHGGKLIAFDKDGLAMAHTKDTLTDYNFITFINADFKSIKKHVNEKVDGILLDLGVSSYQLDTPSRGFSYRFDGDLDMRMDRREKLTAKDVVNNYSRDELLKILYTYGEESYAKCIVDGIIARRNVSPINTTKDLTETIYASVPKKYQVGGSPYKKTFQAIRIEVNGELSNLDTALNDMIDMLNPGGRLCVLTFHSLEDRIVKNVFNYHTTNCICDKSIPVCVCGHKADCKLINKKPIVASKEELSKNKRSASAKLRVIEKL